MTRGAYDLPPLESLVAFESAARHLSFTRAADEIALTQSAISRQIQALESRLGATLFRRLHRALALTDDGRTLQLAVVDALVRLDRATRDIRRAERVKTVVLTTTAGFAGLWLIPRLAGFVAAHPGVDVRISTGNEVVNLERDGVDVAVRYRPVDAALPAGAVPLFGETVYPVCSPKLRASKHAPLKQPADLAHHILLRMESGNSSQLMDWDLWLHALGLADLKPAGMLHFSSYDQLISAAIAGQGIALGRMPLIERVLAEKKLVAPFSRTVASPRSYCVIVSTASSGKPEVRAFVDWLAATAAPSAPGRAPGSARRPGRARS
ncbi:MAG TPA: LysR substrate-binding domain-containing protein [Caldimonas sp.]|jgi:DNA-binding transcriptional LysR family regulator